MDDGVSIVSFTLEIVYEDNHLLVLNKSAGDLVQGDKTGDQTLADRACDFLRQRDNKPGNVFLGVPHRLDRPVSGIVIYAKTSKALSRLSELFRQGTIRKYYWAVTASAPRDPEGALCHYLKRDRSRNKSLVVDSGTKDAKEARLSYRTLGVSDSYVLLEVELITGRHHQIRCQLAHIGCPIKGDLKYGARRSNPDGGISLHARSVSFVHPVNGKALELEARPPSDRIWDFFYERYGQS